MPTRSQVFQIRPTTATKIKEKTPRILQKDQMSLERSEVQRPYICSKIKGTKKKKTKAFFLYLVGSKKAIIRECSFINQVSFLLPIQTS